VPEFQIGEKKIAIFISQTVQKINSTTEKHRLMAAI